MKPYVKIIISAAVCFTAFSCRSTITIPADATSTQLIQSGQDALEFSNYNAAEAYYNAVIQRYGMDTSTYIEARYELGHMYLKHKKYEKAYSNFNEILEIFKNAEPGVLPASYKKLALLGMSKIPQKYIPESETEKIQ